MANDPSEKVPAPQPPEGTAANSSIPSKPAAPADTSKPAETNAAKPAAAPPKAPGAAPAAKEAPPKPVPLENELVARLKARFGDGIREASLDRKQAIVLIAVEQLRAIARYCRDEEKFDMLVDLTAVDWPKRENRFDVVVNLYSFGKNERLRMKAHAGENEPAPSLCEIWPAANWLERECYDMFGIVFEGHPDLKRILLPDEWQGHPLRKDYDILKQDTDWVRENLGIESGQ
ncbi:MAG: NADH-quinone oxidoreductase subunit C [Candidatus Acidiferrales bacterium]